VKNAYKDKPSRRTPIAPTEVKNDIFEEKAVRTVIEVLHDGERGFQSLSKEIKNLTARAFFQEEAATRAKFANDLESALSAETGKSIQEGGTASGAVHTAWGEIKGKMGGSDHALLETAAQGEDAAKKAYEEAPSAAN